MIFAWNDEDPVNDVWKPHGPNNKRIVVDMLLNFKDKNENMDQLIEESESGNKLEFSLKNVFLRFNCYKPLFNKITATVLFL